MCFNFERALAAMIVVRGAVCIAASVMAEVGTHSVSFVDFKGGRETNRGDEETRPVPRDLTPGLRQVRVRIGADLRPSWSRASGRVMRPG
jgi:hypothetical protein